MTTTGNAFEPQEGNGVSDTKQKLYLAQLREELQEWVEEKLAGVWAKLDTKASKSAVATIITIGLVAIGIFSGGIVYVSQVDKTVAQNSVKIENIEHTIAGQNEMLKEILDAVKK